MSATLATVLFSDALHAARTQGASDVHLLPGLPPFLRINGRLEVGSGPGVSGPELRALAETLLDKAECDALDRSGDATVMMLSEDTPIRIHVSRVGDGVTVALRLLACRLPVGDELALPQTVFDVAKKPSGLLIIGGPTGSGKSTTLAAIVSAINQEMSRKILTIEDPIEYRFTSQRCAVVQRQVGRDVGTFSDAVIGGLRSDPDVIVIGEMRDSRTVAAAIDAAETGHLVLTTLHTADAAQAIDRLTYACVAEEAAYVRARIARVLLAVISQRLLPPASGSSRCLAAEVLLVNDAVRHLIRDGKQHQLQSVIATSRRLGMQTLEAHVSELAAVGKIAAGIAASASW